MLHEDIFNLQVLLDLMDVTVTLGLLDNQVSMEQMGDLDQLVKQALQDKQAQQVHQVGNMAAIDTSL